MDLSNLLWLLAGTLIPSFVLCWAAVWIVRPWAVKMQLVDRPGARKVHTSPTPMGGGLAIWFGVVSCFAARSLGVIKFYWKLLRRYFKWKLSGERKREREGSWH